jgi:hypothetical protein
MPAAVNETDASADLVQRISDTLETAKTDVDALKRQLTSTRGGASELLSKQAGSSDLDAQEAVSEPEVRELNERLQEYLFSRLEVRMSSEPEHYDRHNGVRFESIRKSLEADPAAMFTLYLSERTGGAPDVRLIVGDQFIFCESSKEAPGEGDQTLKEDEQVFSEDVQRILVRGRRNCVYNRDAQKRLEARGLQSSTLQEAGDFNGNAVDANATMGFDDIVGEKDYEHIQKTGDKQGHNQNTWVWQKTALSELTRGVARCGCRDGARVYSDLCSAGRHDTIGSWRGLLGVQIVS